MVKNSGKNSSYYSKISEGYVVEHKNHKRKTLKNCTKI